MFSNFFKMIVSALSLSAVLPLSGITPFREGEKVIFLGDSITHGGDFIRWTQFLYHLRNPGQLFLDNAGVSGGTASGGFERLSRDVLARKPERVFIMFGMNDLNNSLYRSESKEMETKRAEAMTRYKEYMEKICNTLEKEKIKIVLMTPTPYNQYAKGVVSTYNEAGLGKGAEFIWAFAKKRGYEVVEFHKPFTEVIKKLPAAMPMRVDNVHPNYLGQLLMAYFLWKDMKIDGKMGTAILDGATGKVEKAERTRISQFHKSTSGISFQYSPEKLPFILDPKNHAGIDTLVPFTKEFNTEFLQVKNLPAGKYALIAGNRNLRTYDAAELAAGINLAELRTPAFFQAHKGYQAVMSIRRYQSQLRCIVQGDCLALSKNGDINDLESSFKAVDTWYDCLVKGKSSNTTYYSNVLKAYKTHKPNKKAIEAKLEEAVAKLRKECKPVSYKIVLRKK